MTCYQCGKEGEARQGNSLPDNWGLVGDEIACARCLERQEWKKSPDRWEVTEPAKLNGDWEE